MEEWLEIRNQMKKKLDRDLQQEEIDFLKWLYEKHKLEITEEVTVINKEH